MDDDTTGELPVDPDGALRGEDQTQASPFAAYRPRRHRQWDVLLAIALGGGFGSVARHLVGEALPARAGHFPWGTFWINVTGSFALGFLMVMILDVWPPTRYVRPLLCIGFVGGFTTFSTLAVETRGLAADGRLALADAYALDSLVAGLVAVWAGIALARIIAGQPVRRADHSAAHSRKGHGR
jgi:CrcB protein